MAVCFFTRLGSGGASEDTLVKDLSQRPHVPLHCLLGQAIGLMRCSFRPALAANAALSVRGLDRPRQRLDQCSGLAGGKPATPASSNVGVCGSSGQRTRLVTASAFSF